MKVKTGLKNPKNHVGSFSSYQIDTAVLETAASWTAMDHISWKKTVDQYIRGQNGKIPSNSGQIAKLYLEDKENMKVFSMYTKGKMSNCMIEFVGIKPSVFLQILEQKSQGSSRGIGGIR